MTHELKVVPEFFDDLVTGMKRFEVRKEDDKHFFPGDKLVLREWDGKAYTGRRLELRVTYVLRAFPGIEAGYAVLSLQ